MGKRRISESEIEKLEHLIRENQHLKKEVSRLRKALARVDIEKFEQMAQIEDYQERQEAELQAKKQKELDMLKRWKCHTCEDGILRLLVIQRKDGIFYLRKCDKCDNRTKLKQYTPEVEGLK